MALHWGFCVAVYSVNLISARSTLFSMNNSSGGVATYFENRAKDYDRDSSRGLWALVRGLESRTLLGLAGPLVDRSVLELGCGTGFYSRKMAERGASILGVDSSPSMIEVLGKNGLRGHCADISTLNLGEKFDLILAAGVLEFLDSADRFFLVAGAHAREGASLVLLAPRQGLRGLAYKFWHQWKECETRIFSIGEIENAAYAAGWKVREHKGAGPLAVAFRFEKVKAAIA